MESNKNEKEEEFLKSLKSLCIRYSVRLHCFGTTAREPKQLAFINGGSDRNTEIYLDLVKDIYPELK